MNYELQYYENLEEKCFDFKINTKNGSGELGLEYSLFHVWEIYGDERNLIKYQNEPILIEENIEFNFFGFDQIQIEGNQNKLNEFYKEISNSAFLERQIKSEHLGLINVNGIYNSSSNYDLGEFNSNIKNENDFIRKMNREQFLVPQGEAAVVYEVLSNKFVIDNLNNVMKKIDHDCSDGKIYPELNAIKFLWKGRIVNQIIRQKVRKGWCFQSADWWDNCLNPKWLEFKKKNKEHGS